METPSSMRRVTRSQTSVASQKTKKEDMMPRSALVDITNDSPIVGLAMGSLTEKSPSASLVMNRVSCKNTPGSGEALLRGQVKALLQKVEEEAEFVNKLSSGDRVPLGITGSNPIRILAPTPANTPQVLCVSEGDGTENAPIQVAKAVNAEECLINRALLFDSPESQKAPITKSAISSSISYEGGEVESVEDDSSSAWSIQVNISVEEEEEFEDFEEEEEEEEEEEVYDESFDELCEGLSKMTVEEKFVGKHTKFVYNSDDEIEGEVMLLKGLPVPEGKHLRFHDDEEEEEEDDDNGWMDE